MDFSGFPPNVVLGGRISSGREKGKRRRSHDAVCQSSPAPVLAAHAWVWRDPRRGSGETHHGSPQTSAWVSPDSSVGLVRPTVWVLPDPNRGVLVFFFYGLICYFCLILIFYNW